mgnify:CR=1 FL=1
MKGRQLKREPNSLPKALLGTLEEFRQGILELQRALLLAERETYERIYGPVTSTDQLIHLALNDPWFTWLLPLSRLAVRLEDVLKEGSNAKVSEAVKVLMEAQTLLHPSPEGEGFERSYYEALRRNEEAALAHTHLQRVFMLAAA